MKLVVVLGWQYFAMLARSLARWGDRNGACRAAHAAVQRAATPTARATAEQVRASIEAGCYDPEAPVSCTDPLRDQPLFDAVPAAEFGVMGPTPVDPASARPTR